MSHSLLASQEMLIEVVRFVEQGLTARTSKALQETIYIIWMNDMIVKSQQLNCFLSNLPILRRASSPTFSPSCISKSYKKVFLITISSTPGMSSTETQRKFLGS